MDFQCFMGVVADFELLVIVIVEAPDFRVAFRCVVVFITSLTTELDVVVLNGC